MTQEERQVKLIRYLLEEMPQFKEQAGSCGSDTNAQFQLLRSLMNVRPPIPASAEFLSLQNSFLTEKAKQKGIVSLDDLEPVGENIYLWQGDITTLAADGIVNAANSRLLGCFSPCHRCIDNAIHTFSGVQLRLFCAKLMREQGHDEPPGRAKITPAFNLPSKYVLHTVGPVVTGRLTEEHCRQLYSCYRSCLELADKNGLRSLAFCCISTGEFHFPNSTAAEIAVRSVLEYIREKSSKIEVIFNVFKQTDLDIYRGLLRSDRKLEK